MDLFYTQEKHLRFADALICLPFLIIPLFLNLPYRVNIFLSWEGAYRLYLGQIPFKDFGLPMGFGYWLIPALFFKIFGPSFFTLIKAQVFINLISVLSLRGILYNLKVKPVLVTLAILVFCLTYVIYNFWPWYNHSVVVFELGSLYFLTRYLVQKDVKYGMINIALGALLAFLSFFTKQDAGALCFLLGTALLVYHGVNTRNFLPLGLFVGIFIMVAAALILPFLPYDFFYWFNYGQPPHDPRFSFYKVLEVFLAGAQWEKIYLAAIFLILVIGGSEKFASILKNREQFMLALICFGLVGQAAITRATSPLPTDHMTYFHAFGIVGLITLTNLIGYIEKPKVIITVTAIAILSFSGGYWRYVQGLLSPSSSGTATAQPAAAAWIRPGFRGFEHVLLPQETADGVKRLLHFSGVGNRKDLKVLNMSELTPLALEMNYEPLKNQPLWYHLNIGIFQKEVDELCQRVRNEEYDIVLFEDIPDLTHFYPYQVRDTLRRYYHLNDSFMAPRKLENSMIEVYVRKQGLTSNLTTLATH